jgi:hypothetical protein
MDCLIDRRGRRREILRKGEILTSFLQDLDNFLTTFLSLNLKLSIDEKLE